MEGLPPLAPPGPGRPGHSPRARPLRVARIASVFEVPSAASTGRGARFDPLGGMQNDAGQLTRALDRLGVVQTVVTAYRPGAPRFERIGDHGAVWRVGVPSRKLRQFYSVPASWRLPLSTRSADLVHAHLAEDLAIVPLALGTARLRGLPLVVTIHTSLTHTLRVSGPRSALLKSLGGGLERLAERRAAAVIALTPRTAELLVRHGIPAARVHMIPPGVERGRFLSPDPGLLAGIPRPRVLFLGRLHAQKDVATLIRATRHLSSAAHVVLVGDGPQRPRLETLAAALGVAHRVHFHGFASARDVPAVLAGADVLVLPSRYEELGSVLLEAMAARAPIVAARTGGIPDIVSHGVNGLLVPPGDEAAVARAITTILGDKALADRLREGGQAVAARHDADSLAERVLGVYSQLADGSSRLPGVR